MLFSLPWLAAVAFLFFGCLTHTASAASIAVAASNSSPEAKSRADLVCDGKDDQVELLESITRCGVTTGGSGWQHQGPTNIDYYRAWSVEWLPGDYTLDASLVIPNTEDFAIQAEGTVFHYTPADGDAIVTRGMNRCRFRFGTIETRSTGAAIHMQPTDFPALWSIIGFMGLAGHDQNGIGLFIDSSMENVCTNKFEGTHIHGFDTGILVGDARMKCDTNWFWLSIVVDCNTCIWEMGKNVDDNVWNVNVEANLDGAVGFRTAAEFGKWYVIMGTLGHEGVNDAFILDPGARDNVIEVHPPLDRFKWTDNSGNDTNVILTSRRPPYRVER